MLTRYGPRRRTGLGDVGDPSDPSSPFNAWATSVKQTLTAMYGPSYQAHGSVTRVPSTVPPSWQQWVGYPAAMYDNATYVTLFNAGAIDPTTPQTALNNGQYVLVLAPGVADGASPILDTAPHTMTPVEQAENYVFSHADSAASALGLPSLDAIENFLKGMGRDVLVGVGVSLAIAYLLKRKR